MKKRQIKQDAENVDVQKLQKLNVVMSIGGTEPKFVNVSGAHGSIPRNRFRQAGIDSWIPWNRFSGSLKVHKDEKFLGSDFEFCTISLLVMLKY